MMTPMVKNEVQSDAASASDFFAELSPEFLIHELKDPLSVIETGVRTLLERQDKFGPLSERQGRTLKRVLRNTCKAREMVYGLLEVGRSEAQCFSCALFEPAPVLMDTVVDTLELLDGALADELRAADDNRPQLAVLAKAGIDVQLDGECGRRQMFQDETKFRQIAGNLLKNAFHHRSDRIGVHLSVEADQLVLTVSDDGPGIKAEHRELIFRRYAQVACDPRIKRRGHGLGLAGALLLARSLGGDLAVESRRGTGAVFRLALPFHLPRSGLSPPSGGDDHP
jgi:two-component system OmpR family sensor kinase